MSLIELTSFAEALHGAGPIAQAAGAGLEVWASAPLNGGELADLVTPDLAEFIDPGSSNAAAALSVVASTPGLTGALLSASTTAHWQEASRAFRRPAITLTHLQDICRVLEPDDPDIRERMHTAFADATSRLGCAPADGAVEAWGHGGRTIGAPVTTSYGNAWLRVLEAPAGEEGGKLWTGAQEAAATPQAEIPPPATRLGGLDPRDIRLPS